MPPDSFGREIDYLRISLTDRCNLRCVYCMPAAAAFRPRPELLQTDELLRLVRLFAEAGFRKFRLTGGEPTLRPDIVELVRAIARVPGVQMLVMTSNGILLKKLAGPLAEAGLHRVNFSVDTLRPDKFRRLTGQGELADLWAGIQAAEAAGLLPIKLNTVVMRGHNDDDLPELAALTLRRPWQVRFIEMMPLGSLAEFHRANGVTTEEICARLEAAFGPLVPLEDGMLDGEARLYRIPGAIGSIGFISSVTNPFCHTCSRVRLTADGKLRLCLLDEEEIDLLTPLRAGAAPAALRQMILDAIRRKPAGHRLAADIVPHNRSMSEVGG